MEKNSYQKNLGLTMIELLVVISLIGVLAGVTMSIINPTKQKETAQDGVKIANVQNLFSAIEAYYAGEGSYPANNSGVPASSTLLNKYLNGGWPSSSYVYWRMEADWEPSDVDYVCISTASSTDDTALPGNKRHYKIINMYSSETGGSPQCAGVVLDCPYAQRCQSGHQGNDIGNCKLVATGAACTP